MMKNLIPLLCIVFLLPCCASGKKEPVNEAESALADNSALPHPMQAQLDKGNWLTYPRDGDLIVLGIANRQSKREDEIRLALEDAAYKVALFNGIKGKASMVTGSGSQSFDFFADASLELDYDKDYQKYQKQLIFDPEDDLVVSDGAVYIRVRYKTTVPLQLSYQFNTSGKRPEWMNKPPANIENYLVGIGFARAQRRIKDTILKSYEAAIAALIAQVSSQLLTNDRFTSDNAGSSGKSSSTQISEASLVDFCVLETWIDPLDKSIWTLAIAKSIKQ
ncbi:MAG: hypothetical protein LBV68_00115 [Spirochaetaceae bacterium]|jgi:hypothetical protein|nr:hypothetical protein [Spirochaetaceae bacterium]